MTKKRDKEQRVEEILQAALEEFADKGYGSVSMDSIAARAGLSKGGVYYHFQSKDEMLLAAHRRLAEPVEAMMSQAGHNPSPREGIRGYIADYLQYWDSHRRELFFYLQTLPKALNWPEAKTSLSRYTQDLIAFFDDLFRQAVAAGELRPHNTRASALALVSALDGALGALVIDEELHCEEVVALFAVRFLDDLRGDQC